MRDGGEPHVGVMWIQGVELLRPDEGRHFALGRLRRGGLRRRLGRLSGSRSWLRRGSGSGLRWSGRLGAVVGVAAGAQAEIKSDNNTMSGTYFLSRNIFCLLVWS